MMSLDLILFIVLLLCFAYGVLMGLLRLALSLAALILRSLAVWLLGVGISYFYDASFLSSTVAGVLIGTAFFTVVYMAVLAMGRRLIKTRALAFSKGAADRFIGGVFSLCADAVVLLLLIWFFDCIGQVSLERNERLRVLWSESRVCQWAGAHNPLYRLGPVRRIEGFLIAVRDPEARSRLHDQSAYAGLLENPRWQAITTDDGLIDAFQRQDWIGVFGNSRVRALLADEKFWHDLSSVKWESALGKDGAPSWMRATAPAHPSILPELPPERRVNVGSPSLAKVILKRGTVLRGVITREDAAVVTLNVLMNGGAISMDISRAEIERIERADFRQSPHDTAPK